MDRDFLHGIIFGVLIMLLVARMKKMQQDIKQAQESLEFQKEAIAEIYRNINNGAKHG